MADKLTNTKEDLPAAKVKPTKKSFFKTSYLLLIMGLSLLSLLGLALYSLQNYQRFTQQLLEKITDYGYTLSSQEKQLASLQADLTRLNKQENQSQNKSAFVEKNILLLQAQHCLKIARLNNLATNDSSLSLALLQQANDYLQQADTVKTAPIRELINKQINTVQTAAPKDSAELLNQVDAALQLTNNLTRDSAKESLAADVSGWRAHWQQTKNSLKNLVVIRHHNSDASYLSPSQQYYARELIRLNLHQAQLAILQKNQQAFVMSLTFAEQELTRSTFSRESGQPLLAKIGELKKLSISPKIDINEQITLLLQQLIDESSKENTGASL